ncbi:asparagine synthase (glutamine-hydrolyzing) [Pusillimonas sp. NJUB218]|uniref:asparagine synthase (glutamine-hydrolyzing) n=1 Tax=Pusillimonas sp. NJUB218 TaxID=2023230 RepID=UPI000F4B6BF2|nr:asparagine synthase (glutamine-hydrolyzing) [Pusillimonas sp. NJUB218]ROT44014.1 asparagine synthase (glutamine-hydrolyzing) [Pusillimonas sp. NJUB218]
MCGILGGVWRKDAPDAFKLDSGISALRFRGPNDSGVERFQWGGAHVLLGHTRLSIIDLTVGGHQPMHGANGRYVVVFNGEIYNYKELREELKALGCQFISDSDTEVLLAAWMVWGKGCLPRLMGMFAFVVFDKESSTLTCVRDAFGIKPFFYTEDSGNFLFASEAPALMALKSSKPQLNWQRGYDYLVHGDYDSRPETFFEGVLHLPPGHMLVVDLAASSVGEIKRWWTPSIQQRNDLSFEDAAELVRENFLHSIRLHLRSDVPLGAALSGGVDSSAVVCAMRHVAPDHPIHTFSYIAAGSDLNEENWADLVNRHVGAISHKVIVTPEELASDLDDMISAQGEPFGSTSIYAQYRVYKLAKDSGITVTLDGQGADEMLAGYNGYPGPRFRSLLETGQWVRAWRFLNAWAKWPGRSRAMGLKMLAAEITDGALYQALRRFSGRKAVPEWVREDVLLHGDVSLRHPRLRPNFDLRGRRVVAELAHSLTERGLSSLLRHGDRNSMRFSIESRVPFLTHEQAELLLSLPEHYLISLGGETKSVFRAAMRGIVPDEILDRKDKVGFQTPEQLWLTSMSGTVREWLRADIGLPFLDQAAILREFDEIIGGRKAFSWQVWRWINFIRWHQHFLT